MNKIGKVAFGVGIVSAIIAAIIVGAKATARAMPIPFATLLDFQYMPATGTCLYPECINDGNPYSVAQFNSVGQYAEVNFGKVVAIRQWRQFGNNEMTSSGTYKLQYYNFDDGSWVDWVAEIVTRPAWMDEWSDFAMASGISTDRIKLVATSIDTAGYNKIGELEIIY